MIPYAGKEKPDDRRAKQIAKGTPRGDRKGLAVSFSAEVFAAIHDEAVRNERSFGAQVRHYVNLGIAAESKKP